MATRRHQLVVTEERIQEIREEIANWDKRTACQISPHMRIALDLFTLWESAQVVNARMMAELIKHDPAYQKAEAQARG